MIFPLILTLLSWPLLADVVQIHSVHPTYLKLNDGRVAYSKETFLFSPGQIIEVELDENHEIMSFAETRLSSAMNPPASEEFLQSTPYQPTIIRNYTIATNLLMTFNPRAINGSQCYDRAHVWTYEALRNQNVQLGKAWLFFSDNYIERYNFKWWFHVAPVGKVIMKGIVEDRILDREFAKFPMQFKIWTDKFMENKVDCKFIQKYSDYSRHPYEDDCFILKSTPYFWQPKDLESFERTGNEKRDYVTWEVSWAFKNGFGL
jgi:hypothetical protein